jgi:hypothetical protein
MLPQYCRRRIHHPKKLLIAVAGALFSTIEKMGRPD